MNKYGVSFIDGFGEVPDRKNAVDIFVKNYKPIEVNMNQVYIVDKNNNDRITTNFTLGEFACHCKSDRCNFTIYSHIGIVRLQKVRNALGKPLHINSSFRCQSHNEAVGGVKNSYHCKGLAYDVSCDDLDELEIELKKQFIFTKRYDSFIHCDLRVI